LLSTLSLKYSDVILAGNFNSIILIEKHLLNDTESLGLFPVIFKWPTYYSTTCNTLLAVFYVSDFKKSQKYGQISLPAFSKHDLIFFTYNINIDYNDYYMDCRDFVNIDYALLSADLDSCDWNSLYCTAEANTQLEILQRKVKILYDRTVPLKRKMCKHRAKSWFNYVIKNIIQKHDKSYAKRKRYKTQNFYNDFKSNRKLVNENWSLQSRNEITTYINSDIQKTIKIHGQF